MPFLSQGVFGHHGLNLKFSVLREMAALVVAEGESAAWLSS